MVMLRILILFVGILAVLIPAPLHSSLVEIIMEENSMEKLISTLKRHEGVKTHAYRDSLGVLTIGCGRNISGKKPNKGIGLTIDEIEYMLQNDVERTIKELSLEYVWFNDMEEGARRDGIINMHFNLGRFRFAGFKKAIGHMENGSYDAAATEFLDSRWAKQVKGRSLEVTDMIKTNTYV
jgi:lysozyme